MNRNIILSVILSALGVALIVLLFFFIIAPTDISDKIRILDFIVVLFVFAVWMSRFIRPLFKLRNVDDEEFAGMGIQWLTLTAYSILALITVGVSVYKQADDEDFTLYLLIQGALVFLFMIGSVLSSVSSRKAKEVYESEQIKKYGKTEIKQALANLVKVAENHRGVPEDVKRKLKHLQDEVRYISPSTSDAAMDLEDAILNICKNLEFSLSDFEINHSGIKQNLEHLETNITIRRKTN